MAATNSLRAFSSGGRREGTASMSPPTSQRSVADHSDSLAGHTSGGQTFMRSVVGAAGLRWRRRWRRTVLMVLISAGRG